MGYGDEWGEAVLLSAVVWTGCGSDPTGAWALAQGTGWDGTSFPGTRPGDVLCNTPASVLGRNSAVCIPVTPAHCAQLVSKGVGLFRLSICCIPALFLVTAALLNVLSDCTLC